MQEPTPEATGGEAQTPTPVATATGGATDAPAENTAVANTEDLPRTGLDQQSIAMIGMGLLLMGLGLHGTGPRRVKRAEEAGI